MNLVKYFPRIADSILQGQLKSSGAVLIAGPKGCGKSTTAIMNASSVVMPQGIEDDNTVYTARLNLSAPELDCEPLS